MTMVMTSLSDGAGGERSLPEPEDQTLPAAGQQSFRACLKLRELTRAFSRHVHNSRDDYGLSGLHLADLVPEDCKIPKELLLQRISLYGLIMAQVKQLRPQAPYTDPLGYKMQSATTEVRAEALAQEVERQVRVNPLTGLDHHEKSQCWLVLRAVILIIGLSEE